jgi:hypothetical protein
LTDEVNGETSFPKDQDKTANEGNFKKLEKDFIVSKCHRCGVN